MNFGRIVVWVISDNFFGVSGEWCEWRVVKLFPMALTDLELVGVGAEVGLDRDEFDVLEVDLVNKDRSEVRHLLPELAVFCA